MDDIQLCKEITRLKKELQKLVSIPGVFSTGQIMCYILFNSSIFRSSVTMLAVTYGCEIPHYRSPCFQGDAWTMCLNESYFASVCKAFALQDSFPQTIDNKCFYHPVRKVTFLCWWFVFILRPRFLFRITNAFWILNNRWLDDLVYSILCSRKWTKIHTENL